MSYSIVDGDSNAYTDAIYGWGVALEQVADGQKIRVTWKGKKPKTGYAYLENRHYSGIRLTRTSNRWYELLRYQTPLIKLEIEDGKNWKTIWERGN